jgi:5'-nucleotidase
MLLPEMVEYHDEILAAMDRPGFYAELEPVEGAAAALHEMVEAGYDVAICTSPWLSNPTCVQDKLDWAELHIGAGWADKTIITKDKTRVRGHILIDDKPTVTGAVAPEWRHVFFTQAYNAALQGPRISTWAEWRGVVEAELFVAV